MKKPVQPKKEPPSAADVLARKKIALEDLILRACTAFERDTGLVVWGIRHPRDDDRDGLATRPLTDKERIEVGALTPFMPVFRRLR